MRKNSSVVEVVLSEDDLLLQKAVIKMLGVDPVQCAMMVGSLSPAYRIVLKLYALGKKDKSISTYFGKLSDSRNKIRDICNKFGVERHALGLIWAAAQFFPLIINPSILIKRRQDDTDYVKAVTRTGLYRRS